MSYYFVSHTYGHSSQVYYSVLHGIHSPVIVFCRQPGWSGWFRIASLIGLALGKEKLTAELSWIPLPCSFRASPNCLPSCVVGYISWWLCSKRLRQKLLVVSELKQKVSLLLVKKILSQCRFKEIKNTLQLSMKRELKNLWHYFIHRRTPHTFSA